LKPGRDYYRVLTATAVLIVAGIAATVSFLHISGLALKYGQPPAAAYLMPLSVDGLVATSSLAMLRSARTGVTSGSLARAGLVLGVLATIGANVTSGLTHGPVGAVIAGWPAVAFIVSAEIAIGMSRRKASRIPSREAVTRLETDVMREPDGRPGDGGEPDVTTGRLARQADQDSLALMVVTANPDVSFAELATELGVSESTARRVRARIGDRVTSSNGVSRAT